MITTKELFEEFYKYVKESNNIGEVLKEYGGSSIYLPSYKSTYRNDDIIEEYKKGATVRELSKKYDISTTAIYAITKELRVS